MLKIKIDKTAYSKNQIADYLREIANAIESDSIIGSDWELQLTGIIESEPETIEEPDDFSGATPGDR